MNDFKIRTLVSKPMVDIYDFTSHIAIIFCNLQENPYIFIHLFVVCEVVN